LKDGDEIDIIFDLKYESPDDVYEPPFKKNTRDRKNHQYLAIGECKNYSKSVPVSELTKILAKALKISNSRLSLIFCTRIKGFRTETFQKFQSFCDDNNVQVFRFLKIATNSFKPVLFNNSNTGNESDDKSRVPKLICLIIETAIINDNGVVVADDVEQIKLAEGDYDPLF
jgi:hypothetical protein